MLCSYCSNSDDPEGRLFLTCSVCKINVHVECLKSRCAPGGLLGDNFFNFTCSQCDVENYEQITRQKMPWFALIVLVLYNLHKRSEGVSRRGYFHWKSHICNFINRQWNILFEPLTRRRKTWVGTVAGTLSRYCPSVFANGSEELGEAGWWRLVHKNMTPRQIVAMQSSCNLFVSPQNQATEKKTRKVHGGNEETQVLQITAVEESSLSVHGSPNIIEHPTPVPTKKTETTFSKGCTSTSESLPKASSVLRGFTDIMTNDEFPDLFVKEQHLRDMDVDIEEAESLGFTRSCSDGFQDLKDFLSPVASYSNESSQSSFPPILPDITNNTEDHLPLFSLEDAPRQSPSLYSKHAVIKEEITIEETTIEENSEDSWIIQEITQQQCPDIPKSLFVHTPKEQRTPPWKELEKRDQERLAAALQSKCVQMSEYEELQLLSQLRQASKTQDLPGFARRLYRKLCVRQQKRQQGLPIFNLDNTFQHTGEMGHTKSVWEKHHENYTNSCTGDAPILDRFYHVPMKLEDKFQRQNCSFKIRLMGYNEPMCFLSPYTQRQLKPYIRRDYETTPRWLKLLMEIQAKANKNNVHWSQPQRSPIDYCYVRPQHISTINSLCCEYFYPGIDLSETLQYPDFSCVVLYKKLIIAFAFMVPDAGYNETYITFLFTRPEWRGAGIATFMLYHLIQTCMGKDITLHVSATNSALILYQKFGFKIEEFILDFYDKYLPADSQECKHALFLRLSR